MTKELCKICFILVIFFSPLRADERQPKPFKAPFELLPSKHMAVQIRINGKGPYRILFDTGSPVVLLNNKAARASGVVSAGTEPSFLNLFATLGQFSVRSLEMGALKAENVPAIVMDHPTLAEAAKVLGPLDGIAGFPLFARYRLTIDYAANELTFVPNGYKPADVLQDLMAQLLQSSAAKPDIVTAPAARWGLTVSKPADDRQAGVVVSRVEPGSAAAAGLKAADRLLTLDGRWTDTVDDLYRAAQAVQPGRRVRIVLGRQGRELAVDLTPRAGF